MRTKVWCPARGQTEADAIDINSGVTMAGAALAVARMWQRDGDTFERETFRVSDGELVFDVEIIAVREQTYVVVGSKCVEHVSKEQG